MRKLFLLVVIVMAAISERTGRNLSGWRHQFMEKQ